LEILPSTSYGIFEKSAMLSIWLSIYIFPDVR
jgi:hypothetical protein